MPKDHRKILAEVADKFVIDARLELIEAGYDGPTETLQNLIDAVRDHNQLMIDSTRAVSPDLADVIDELIHVDPDESPTSYEPAYDAWTGLVNYIFRLAEEHIGG